MVISKPCIHPDTAPREGYIRGQYESVEFIREIPRKLPTKSSSTTNLANHTRNRSSTLGKEAVLRNAAQHSSLSDNGSIPEHAAAADTEFLHSEGRARGKTISFDKSRGFEAKGEGMDVPRDEQDPESNPMEWIMITRSDPGGSVPRFMVERGTPGGIVSDASKFLNWACAKDLEDFDDDDETLTGDGQEPDHHGHDHDRDLHNYQTNGHLAGLEEEQPVNEAPSETPETATANGGGYYGLMAGAATAAGSMIASHTPQMISDHLPGHTQNGTSVRRDSVSTVSSDASIGSFTSALENASSIPNNADTASLKTTSSQALSKQDASQDKELQKLEEKKQKLNEKLKAAREKELSRKSEDSAKEEEAIRKAEERHEKEVKKAEEKHQREVEKLEQKKLKEAKKVEERKRKAAEKDERTRLTRELEEIKAEVEILRKERQLMLEQVGALQAENTALAVRVGRMGLLEVQDEVGKGVRSRASSLKGLTRTASFKTSWSAEKDKDKDNGSLGVPNGS